MHTYMMMKIILRSYARRVSMHNTTRTLKYHYSTTMHSYYYFYSLEYYSSASTE